MQWLLFAILPVILSAQDRRNDFQAHAWLALTSDTFAAAEQRDLLYQGLDASTEHRERLTGGFEFAYRLTGQHGPQLWILGQTSHGTRSAEVACTGPAAACIANGRQLVRLLRNSASLEGQLELRAELLPLHRSGPDSAALYVKLSAGFLAISQGGDAYDLHSITAGVLSTGGRFSGSYIEAGWGRSDVFHLNRYRRALVSGHLSWGSQVWRERGLRPFVAMRVDSDLSRGADSIQTSLGFAFDLDRIF